MHKIIFFIRKLYITNKYLIKTQQILMAFREIKYVLVRINSSSGFPNQTKLLTSSTAKSHFKCFSSHSHAITLPNNLSSKKELLLNMTINSFRPISRVFPPHGNQFQSTSELEFVTNEAVLLSTIRPHSTYKWLYVSLTAFEF